MAGMEDDRERMVETQLAARDIDDPAVLQAMRDVPRHAFVPPDLTAMAYDDTPLPIGGGATISQPYIVAFMAQTARIGPGDRVLDVGTGSGYAAAVLGRIAGEVFTIERQADLGRSARLRLRNLGYRNIHARTGDGSLGWPEEAPFDAILVGAGANAVPDDLRWQLAPGGRLVIPVERGHGPGTQVLLRITRTGEKEFETQEFGAVAFVPLVTGPPAGESGEEGAVGLMRSRAVPLPDPAEPDFASSFEELGGARVVLLGEASHGTSEFYRARAAITRMLVERFGFSIIALEADWPDAAAVDRFVRNRPAAPGGERPFRRFPTWMWRNAEFRDLVLWLKEWNGAREHDLRAAFCGLDLYSLHSSMGEVLSYLERTDPETARHARERYACFNPWENSPERYGAGSFGERYGRCEKQVLATLRDLLDKRVQYAARDGEAWLDATRNASLVAAAEGYYRAMYRGSAESWNLRDRHMFDTLRAVMEARGPGAKAVVWAHNSHLGNARATEMGEWGEINLGQLCKERFGAEALSVGFGTDRGTVAAADDWDGPMRVMEVRPARADSYEGLCRETGMDRFMLDLRRAPDDRLAERLREPRLERAIGVIYRPQTERQSHYFRAVLPEQFDRYVWFAETRAVTPLPGADRPPPGEAPSVEETWPFGV